MNQNERLNFFKRIPITIVRINCSYFDLYNDFQTHSYPSFFLYFLHFIIYYKYIIIIIYLIH